MNDDTDAIQPHAAPGGGPYLQYAFFSEKVLTEADGVISAIRIVDRLTVPVDAVTERPLGPPMPLTIAIAFKSGDARGRAQLTIRAEAPTGLRLNEQSADVFFEGNDRGAGALIMLPAPQSPEGLYWFDILLDGALMTRMPLRVTYRRRDSNLSTD